MFLKVIAINLFEVLRICEFREGKRLTTSKMVYNTPIYICVLRYLAMNASEAGGDLVLIQTTLDLSFKSQLVNVSTT